jgi:hypothetical protein
LYGFVHGDIWLAVTQPPQDRVGQVDSNGY